MAETNGITELQELKQEISSLKDQLEGVKAAGTTGGSLKEIASYVYNHAGDDGFVVQKTGEKPVHRFHASAKLASSGPSGNALCCCVVV
mmetsp:Transcript_10957/g.10472  ORF Transcript_10957/g.10472 Transcript_10957/m.10472 type:complete len:89 (-) Transcript_10957:176-442(-)|eukprot:CAMPEP_0197831838 /NCGR_PEP_ID=MMETSP1437-20131217/12327_1 /TAXON_ID=49252 ORGANISM="Eucampia antarctica, Strain CCMP1452" /NCGR_SAMPLE_ID=MMETSP1437 /ASSEMBLY_ACC=CAM_ASM_001096 /LENGTH=88 /DNA_ID=CAMNT_0043434931 /DNA_START=89 /DNA_END=355 /DNA_ORIENTATION=+